MTGNASVENYDPQAHLMDLHDGIGQVPGTGAHIVLFGTQGGPIPGARAATSSALVVDGQIYIIDAGSGLPLRFAEAGLDFTRVRSMLITHLHSDHYADYFNFFQLNWPNWDPDGRTIQLIGPGSAAEACGSGTSVPGLPDAPDTPLISPEQPTPGLAAMDELFIRANAYDFNERLRTTRRRNNAGLDFTGAAGTPMYEISEIQLPEGVQAGSPTPPCEPFLVYQDELVSIRAVLVDHPPVYPSFAFRFDTPYGSVVFSGDTRPCENLITLSHNADVLVNEVMDIDAAVARFEGSSFYTTMARQFLTAHTPMVTRLASDGLEEVPGVGATAKAAGVSGLVLNHVYPGDGSVPDATFWSHATAEFGGPVVVGRDLVTIDVAALTAVVDGVPVGS